MTQLLSIPENVLIQHVFPCLDHNDLLRLRRVSKRTKALASAYLWIPQPGHQGKWQLKIDSSKEDETLEAFLQKGLPPPSRLHIVNKDEKEPSEQRSFFEDDHLEEFMRRYSKYVTHLRVDKLFIPFTSAKEVGFYESFVNLEELSFNKIVTVGGAAQFEEKTRRAEGSFLIRPTWSKKLKILKLDHTDCLDSMWNFINGVSNNFEELLHPFQRSDGNVRVLNRTIIAPVQEFIERRSGMRNQTKLLYDWSYLLDTEPLELLQLFASCRDNGVMIKNLDGRHLDCLFCDENGRIDRARILDQKTGDWTWNARVNYQRNEFVGRIIHSLVGAIDNIFLMDLPALEEISAWSADRYKCLFREDGLPQWLNLRKMSVQMNYCSVKHCNFLMGQVKRPKLEELSLSKRRDYLDVCIDLCPRKLRDCCGNVKKLTISFVYGGSPFFSRLWKWLPLLEDVTLRGCEMLTDVGFVGTDKKRPAFLNLKKLKHLRLLNLEVMTRITDMSFRNVFRKLKLTSFKLSSARAIKKEKITVAGIKQLLTGPFAKTIQKLDLDELQLENVSEEELKQVVSCFRSSKM